MPTCNDLDDLPQGIFYRAFLSYRSLDRKQVGEMLTRLAAPPVPGG